ncbi:MAG: thiamine pyrophosphate-dependent dehydrogenase E1 component subunit alpha [Acidobacteriota bacterium]
MQLTRTLDERVLAYWKQGRGVGGTFSQRGHEAISVGAAYALGPDDVVSPMHRDLGAFLLRGLTPRDIFSNLLGRVTGPTRGRDANLHGISSLERGIIGFISHLPHSLPVALGVAMSFRYRGEPRVAMTFTGDGATNAWLYHETLNMAALYGAPLVVVVENNQYAYSTSRTQASKVESIARHAAGYGLHTATIDGNDVEAVHAAARAAVDRARTGDGPSLIEAHTLRMLGHAVHDGAEYVPRELLAEWKARDPVQTYRRQLGAAGVPGAQLDDVDRRCTAEVEDAVEFAAASPWPDPGSVADGVYAP